MNLSNEIKIIRQKAFMTQEAFAKALNVAFSTVNRWESGKTHPNMTAMKQLKIFCDVNNISFDELQNAWLKSKEVK
ncbi:MAG: helix-turn-helix transcriptional regulator [Synergistes jonesii]|uniref:helix-turn-helix domain-containing protein n=1 Tax=Synergistes jonesii TaxID=2754 RepID=UPI002A758FC8|nr:helix-turn-helix transcriptional regulator [Synergistes jonesii]MDY2985221.1 helix-turn-helix transcriptional regulator [Synergistes jonesii]